MTDDRQTEIAAHGGTSEACCSALPRPVVDCDREAGVKDRIAGAIALALAVVRTQRVRADEHAVACALDGIANGAAVEIIHTLGMQPGFVNLRHPPNAQISGGTPSAQPDGSPGGHYGR